MNNQSNPYGLKIEWLLLNKDEYNLSSPVIVGEKYYIIGKMKKEAHAEEAFGYEFEEIILFLKTKGIGTTWMAGTFPRKDFEKVIDLKEDEVMPCVTPIGYKAPKMSFREKLMRKGIKADTRKKFNDLFFINNFETNLNSDELKKYEDLLELVKIAPSAVNKQPWRLLIINNNVHFFKKPSSGFNREGIDIQKVDIGIAMNHLVQGLKDKNINYKFECTDPAIKNEDFEYVSTVVLLDDLK